MHMMHCGIEPFGGLRAFTDLNKGMRRRGDNFLEKVSLPVPLLQKLVSYFLFQPQITQIDADREQMI